MMVRTKQRIPKQATKIAKERKHNRERAIKTATRINAKEFFDRHLYCVNMQDIYQMMEDPEMGVIISENPKAHKAVCDHPEDGFCFHGLPDPDTLQKINDKLAFRSSAPKEESNDLEVVEDGEPPEDYQRGTVIRAPGANHPPSKKFKLKIGGKAIVS